MNTSAEQHRLNVPRSRSSSSSRALFQALAYAVLSVWFILAVLPFLWTIMTSTKTVVDALSIPPVWWYTPDFEAYRKLWLEEDFGRYLLNSVIVTLGTVGISISVGCLAGYGLARYKGKIGFWILFAAFVFRAFPRMTFLLPFYFIARLTNSHDTHVLLILVLVSINQPFTIWMLRSFFMEIPESLEESAMVDGCNRFQAFWYVIVPIMGPGIVTASIFSMLLAYNEFLIPLVLTATNATPLPVAISQFAGAEDLTHLTISAAGAVSIALPIVIIVFLLQRFVVKGLTSGAVKG
jgi:multiple sugar transport system permease protein